MDHVVEEAQDPVAPAGELLRNVDWDAARAILPRYARPVPRYTSYPTTPAWEPLGCEPLVEELARLGEPGRETLSLYVHVPFCRSLCHFCACNRVVTRDPELPDRWLDALFAELATLRSGIRGNPRVTQIHWGGGTPTHLTPRQLGALAARLAAEFDVAPDAERSLEVDPRVTCEAQLAVLREHGFDRVSLGIQDFDERVQQAVHRIQPVERVASLVHGARAMGFRSVNFDLIYGLPLQTLASFERTLDRVLALAPDRVALYGYAHVTWVAKQQRGFERHHLPGPDERLSILVRAIQRFCEAGYRYVGMDHFARPGDELVEAAEAGTLRRNFMGYTTQAGTDLLALGPSGISELGRVYAQSQRELGAWTETVTRGALATFRGRVLSDDDVLRRFVVERIMCAGAVSAAEVERRFPGEPFARRFAPALRELSASERDGLVRIASDGSLRVEPLGRLLVRHVAAAFDAHLPRQRDAGEARFSQGV